MFINTATITVLNNLDKKKGVNLLKLSDLGWNPIIEDYFKGLNIKNLIPGRVIKYSGKQYKIITIDKEINATLSNSFFKTIKQKIEFPSVGDWVGLKNIEGFQTYQIISLFPRKNKLSRKVTGKKSEEQIIASNIDIVFIITSVDRDYNIRRIERLLSMVYEINAKPIIILNKIDKNLEYNKYLKETEEIFKNIPIIAISAKEGYNVKKVSKFIETGKTVVLIGSSGVGKSTLINQIIGYSRQNVGEIRESDGRGRHITTSRELIILPEGGMLIDNPGIREIQLWSTGVGISKTFEDIGKLSQFCRFKDCIHDQEPGCAVKKAVDNGDLSIERLQSYKKLIREQEFSQLRRNIYERKKKDKQLGKLYRQAEYIRKYRGKK